MSGLKVTGTKIRYRDCDLSLVFNLNVMDRISDTYATVESMAKAIGTAKGQKVILCALINDAIETHNEESEKKVQTATINEIGRKIGASQMPVISDLIVKAFRDSLPNSDLQTSDEDDDIMGETKAE